jgi:hypothetical protein
MDSYKRKQSLINFKQQQQQQQQRQQQQQQQQQLTPQRIQTIITNKTPAKTC